MSITIVKCPCGHECCSDYHLIGIGKFVQGSGFTEKEAIRIRDALNAYPDHLAYLENVSYGGVSGKPYLYIKTNEKMNWSSWVMLEHDEYARERLRQLHAHWHQCFDLLLAGFISSQLGREGPVLEIPIRELLDWSFNQTLKGAKS